jgi:hypothetical protein
MPEDHPFFGKSHRSHPRAREGNWGSRKPIFLDGAPPGSYSRGGPLKPPANLATRESPCHFFDTTFAATGKTGDKNLG